MGQGTVFCEDEFTDYNHVKAYFFFTNTCHAFYQPNTNLIFPSRMQAILPTAAQ
jgi:hypothetical protein